MAGLALVFIQGVALSQPAGFLSVKDAVAAALEKNPRLLAAKHEVDATDARILQAGRIANPVINFVWDEVPTDFSLGDAEERDIGITQEIEFPTRRSARIDVATHDLSLSELRLERFKTLIIAETKKAYYETRFSQEIVDGLKEQLLLLQDIEQHLSDRYRAGAGSYLDVLRTKVEVARLRNDLAEAGRKARTRWTELSLLIANEADNVPVLTDTLIHDPVAINGDSLTLVLLENSSMLKIAREVALRQAAAVSLAKASYLPDFSLGVSHQWRSGEPPYDANQFTGTTSNSIGFELGISVPLWFWQEPKGLVQEAEALESIAGLDSASIARRVRAAVANAVAAVVVAREQLKVFDELLLEDTKDVVATSFDSYRNNQIDLLNLLDVYRTARDTRLEYARALMSHSVALAELEAAGELPFEGKSE